MVKCVQLGKRQDADAEPAVELNFELEPNPANSKEEVVLVDDSCYQPDESLLNELAEEDTAGDGLSRLVDDDEQDDVDAYLRNSMRDEDNSGEN